MLTASRLTVLKDLPDHVPEGKKNSRVVVIVLGIELVQAAVVSVER